MHAAGIHSALALRRARKSRENQKRARDRRLSSHSTESGVTSPRLSITSYDAHRKRRSSRQSGDGDGNVSSIGMLHIGVVFLVLGLFLLGSGLIPDDNTKGWAGQEWWNELVASGSFLLGIGIFLLVLNAIMSKREEDELHDYVQGQLTRSRSGHRLERDVETGVLVTKHHRKYHHTRADDFDCIPSLSPVDEFCPRVHQSPPLSAGSVRNNGNLDQILEEEAAMAEYVEEQRQYPYRVAARGMSRENSPITSASDYRKQTVFTYPPNNFGGGQYCTVNV